MSARRIVSRWALPAMLLTGTPMLAASCGEDPVSVQVRSLERSGALAFLCLGAIGTAPRPLSDCTSEEADSTTDFEVPHLYALVTQLTRGEVAVVDLTSATDPVLDQDPRTPGANFLPTGAQPQSIVATPGSSAAFVAAAEIGKEGIYALPSERLRPCATCDVPTLTSWPACALPSAPGEMVVISDPWVDGQERATCDAAYGSVSPGATTDLSKEGAGRQKLVVTLPDLGGIAVIDAQELLDRPAGSFDGCTVERWLPLDTPSAGAVGPTIDAAPGCAVPAASTPPPGPFSSRPSGLAVADGRLYIGDLDAPIVHVLDVASPCNPVELPGLVPSSYDEPARLIRTSQVDVSPLTPDFKRYLYAIDVEDGSAMVFDVSEGATSLSPLVRPDAALNPAQPPDRIKYRSPVQDIVLVQRDEPAEHPATGVAPVGTRCDPDPSLEVCTSTSTTCDPGTLYRTSDDFETGAGPFLLRGTYGFLLLASGAVVVIDIDDYDAACRAPTSGCGADYSAPAESSGEVSCRSVLAHQGRSAEFLVHDPEGVGLNEPGIEAFPLLVDANGTLIPPDDLASPRMRAVDAQSGSLVVGSNRLDIVNGTIFDEEQAPRHALAMNFDDPRSHVAAQTWNITYEGTLPNFAGLRGDLRLTAAPEEQGVYDEAARYCDKGTQSETAVRERLEAQGLSGADLDAESARLADRLTIVSPLTDEDNFYWNQASCSFAECRNVFGTADNPTPARDFRIIEAYQDHVLLASSDVPGTDGSTLVSDEQVECCFPTLVEYRVRPGNQWIAEGSVSGFLHNMIADPATGVCRPSCDPTRVLETGRIPRYIVEDNSVNEGLELTREDPRTFVNPTFRVAITDQGTAKRGQRFELTSQGSFRTLVVNLATDTIDVQPQAMRLLPATGELVVADGSLLGLVLVGTDSLAVERQYQ